MPNYPTVSQKSFVKGLNSSTSLFSQPQGSLPKISNLLYTIRGALRTVFGGSPFISYQGAGRATTAQVGPIKRIAISLNTNPSNAGLQYQANGFRAYFFLHDGFLPLVQAYNLTLTGVNVAGGILTPGNTYSYEFGMVDDPNVPVSGHVGAAVSASIVLPGGMNAVRLTWTPLPGPWGYVITKTVGGGQRLLNSITSGHGLVQNIANQQQFNGGSGGPTFTGSPAMSFTDLSYGSTTVVIPYGTDTMDVVVLECTANGSGTLTSIGYDPKSQSALAYFPKGPAQQAEPVPGGGSSPSSIGFSGTGGTVGLIGPMPDLIEFANQIICILGNGYPSHSVDLNTLLVSPVANTFTANYPEWAAGITNLAGDNIVPTVANGFYYTCTQAGITGSVEPTWPVIVGQTVVDNQVIWTCTAQTTGDPPPRGAAHGAYYAGSFFEYNTNPFNTADGIDGPSSIRMSDAGAFNSWNPINQAFIGKDDGSEGMGLAEFTVVESGIPPTGSLVMFKNFSSYQMIGIFGAPDLAIQQIQSDMGCIAPRSIQFLSGFGIVRLSHLGFALFNGVRDNLISEELRPWVFGDNPQQPGNLPAVDWTYAYMASASQSVNPPLYICAVPVGSSNGQLRRLFCYDLVLRAWTVIDIPSSLSPDLWIRTLNQVRSPGGQPLTIAGSGADTTIFRMFYGDTTWPDGETQVSWAFTTPEVFNPQSPRGKVYFRKAIIRGRYLGSSTLAANPVSVGLVYDGSDPVGEGSPDTSLIAYNVGYQLFGNSAGFSLEVDINEKCSNMHALISGTGQIEIDSVDWLFQPMSTTIPPRLT